MTSTSFNDLIGSSEFPVVAALYKKGKMDYDHIKNFNFKILKSSKTFTLKNFTTIDTMPAATSHLKTERKHQIDLNIQEK